MKKLILTVLMVVMVATPCFAQKLETDGIFSLHATRWLTTGHMGMDNYYYGFYEGNVYGMQGSYSSYGCVMFEDYFYVDLLVISYYITFWESRIRTINIFQPMIGIGFTIDITDNPPYFWIYLLFKVENNWVPQGCN